MGIGDWVSGAVDKLGSTFDKVQDYAADAVVTVAEPAVRLEIDQRVTTFRDNALSELPRQTEEGLKSKVESGPTAVAWVFNRVLGDNTDNLVSLLVEQFRPGINSATEGLSGNATQTIMAKLKDLLDGRDPQEGTTQQAAAPVQQSRAMFTPDPAGASEAQQQQQIPSETISDGGVRSYGMAAAGGIAGAVFNIEQKLPAFEQAARELVHPLFEQLKGQIWELVPAVLQDVLGPLVGDKQDEVENNPEAAGVSGGEGEQPASLSRGLTNWVQNKLSGKAGLVLDKVMDAALDALDGPLQALIGRLVDELESSSTLAAFQQVRQKLADYKLISNPNV